MTTPLRRTLATAIRNCKSTPVRSITDFATAEIRIPDGRHKGTRYSFRRQPVTRLWLQAIESDQYTEHVYTAPSQTGKTLSGFVIPLLYHAAEVGENVVLGVPYADMAPNKWEADIRPAMAASPSLRRQIPRHGSGSGGGRVRDSITMGQSGAIIKIASAGASDQGKAGFTARVVVVTEAARFGTVGTSSDEADPMRQLIARQNSYGEEQQKRYIEGTVTLSDAMPWRMREQSTQSQILSPCPHCRQWISCERDDLVGWQGQPDENAAAAAAFFACPECGEEITDAQRREALSAAVLVHRGQSVDADGTVIGPHPETRRLWFRMSAWHSLFRSAADLARQEWRAAQIAEDSPERLAADRELCQFVWCIPWDPPAADAELILDGRSIDRRRAPQPRRVAPPTTICLTTGTDIGDRDGWYLVLATLLTDGVLTRHIVDYDRFDIPSHAMPVDAAIRHALTDLRTMLTAGYTRGTDGGGIIHVDESWYDAGHRPSAVIDWIKKHSATNPGAAEIAAYGRGQSMFDRTHYVAPKKKNNSVRQIAPNRTWFVERDLVARTVKLYWDADTGKYEALQSLTLAQGSPGSVSLFAGTAKTHERLVRHLTNEPLVNRTTALGGVETVFRRQGANHLLDCYAMALRAADRCMWRLSIGTYAPDGDDAGGTPPPATGSSAAPWYDTGQLDTPPEPSRDRKWYDPIGD